MPDTQPQETQQKENRSQLLLVALFALSMIALLVIAILFVAPDIEKDLNQKIIAQLEKEGITASVSVSGRDITLSGSVDAADIEKAETITADVEGVHFIDNQLIADNANTDDFVSLEALQQEDNNTSSTGDFVSLEALQQDTDVAPEEATSASDATPTNTDDFVSLDALQQDTDTAPEETTANTDDFVSLEALQQDTDTSATEEQTMGKNSSQAYDKILAAMSRHNEKQTEPSSDEVNKQGTSDNKILVDFDTSRIQFKQDSNILTANAKKALKTLANQLKQSTKTLEITVLSTKSKLAFEQAKAIQSYLVEQGIKKKRLVVIGRNSDGQDTTVIMVEKQTN